MRRLVAVGLITAVAVIVLFGSGAAPGRKLVFHVRNMECWKMPADGRVAALGDSITAGTQDPELGLLGRQSWFAQSVCHDGVAYGYNAAIPGYTTEQVYGRLQKALSYHPRAVVILAGTNDVLHDLPLSRPLDLLRKMATRIRRTGAVPVFATLPPFSEDPSKAEAFDAAVTRLAREERAPLLDFHHALAAGGHYRPGLTTDGLHPSVAGARVMAKVAAPVLRRALERQKAPA